MKKRSSTSAKSVALYNKIGDQMNSAQPPSTWGRRTRRWEALMKRNDSISKPIPNPVFDHAMQERMKQEAPLAARMRPRTLDEYIGQEHIVGEGKLLRRAIEADRLFSSIILWGPPGTGKTTLAQVIANTTKSHFVTISAILAGKADLRVIIEEASNAAACTTSAPSCSWMRSIAGTKPSRTRSCPTSRRESFTLIGATTENPYFEVIKALISRSRVFQLRNLNQEETGILIDRALADKERGYGNKRIKIWTPMPAPI
jgi:putative ATPase